MSDTDSSTEFDRIADLKAQCLQQARSVTALKHRTLTVVLRRSSSAEGEYYCALRDADGRYLKLWMERHRTYASRVEALEAYLRFVKRMRGDCSLFGGATVRAGRAR